MCALSGRCCKGGQVGQRSADRCQPVDSGSGTLSHSGNELDVVDVAAALHSVVDHQLNGVFNACSLLNRSLSSVHTAGGLSGVTAHHSHLLEDNYVLAGSLSLDSSSHASAAGADYYYVYVNGSSVSVACSSNSALILGKISACSGDSCGNSLNDCLAGNRSAGDGVNVYSLVCEHSSGELFNSYSADAGGLAVTNDLDLLDLVAIHGNGSGDIAAKALCSSGSGACCRSCGSSLTGSRSRSGSSRRSRCGGRCGCRGGRCTSCHRSDHHDAEQQCKCLFHVFFSFLLFQTIAPKCVIRAV